MPGRAVRIAVDPNGNAWVVDSYGAIYQWTVDHWTGIYGSASDIGIGANGSVWVVGTDSVPGGHSIWKWNGSGWTNVSGGAIRITVDPSGNPWIVASDNSIWHYVNGAFQQMPGAGVDIGASADNMVWVLGTAWEQGTGGYQIFWWSGIDWVQVPGGATEISAARGGQPWVSDVNGTIFTSY
jgi:hypothetical protein